MEKGHGEKRSRKREEAITALLTSSSVHGAADRIGVDPKTLQGWMREPGFIEEYRKAKREALSEATARLRSTMTEAVDVLRDVMQNTEHPPGPRVSAAKAVLDNAFKAVEVEDLEERLSALEEHIGK
jgi:hypothetical protein